MTTIPEKYTKIILNAIRMGDTGSIPLEQAIQENIERAIDEAGNCVGVTRFEVVDDNGRNYVQWGVKVYQQFQDNGRTLKTFVSKNTAGVQYPTQPE